LVYRTKGSVEGEYFDLMNGIFKDLEAVYLKNLPKNLANGVPLPIVNNKSLLSLNEISLQGGNTPVNNGYAKMGTVIEQHFPKYINGEPVSTPYGRGFVVDTYIYENIPFVKVKFKHGYGHIK
jgi:hypothetical protein